MINAIKNLDLIQIGAVLIASIIIGGIILCVLTLIFENIYYTYHDREQVLIRMKVYKKYTNTTSTYNAATKTTSSTTSYYVKVSGEDEKFTIQSSSLYNDVEKGSEVIVTYSMVYRAKRFGLDKRQEFYSKSPRSWNLAH